MAKKNAADAAVDPIEDRFSLPWFSLGDLDGFFGLFIDNLIQLLLMVFLCRTLCGMTGDASSLLYAKIFPGVAVSLLLGNLFYAWQARRLAWQEKRTDVTALPYGINTPSLLVYVIFVMIPAYIDASKTLGNVEAATHAWQMGLVACLGSGLIEFFGAFAANFVRERTPRAALLSTLAGIAIGFISMGFMLQIFHRPMIAMLPLAIILMTYFSRIRFPLGLPGGLIAVACGTIVAWLLTGVLYFWPSAPAWLAVNTMSKEALFTSTGNVGIYIPQFVGSDLSEPLMEVKQWIGYLSVIIPMGLFNLIGSLQNIESAEASGDRFSAPLSLAANGIGTIVAALFGSCFPTTIYIGHPGWKQMGARSGYSTLNGLVMTLLCCSGSIAVVASLIPIEAGVAIVLWIGLIITAQAFSAVDSEHAPAVAIGLFPAIAAWGLNIAQGAFNVAGGKSIQICLQVLPNVDLHGYLLAPLISLERGYIFTCMILAAMTASLIDRKFIAAAAWSGIGAGFAALGLTHAFQLKGNLIDFLPIYSVAAKGALEFRPAGIVAGYLMMAFACVGAHVFLKRNPEAILKESGH